MQVLSNLRKLLLRKLSLSKDRTDMVYLPFFFQRAHQKACRPYRKTFLSPTVYTPRVTSQDIKSKLNGKLKTYWDFFSLNNHGNGAIFPSHLTVVPLPRVSPRGSLLTAKDSASDSQMCCSSSLCLEVTTTRSATAMVSLDVSGG